MKHFLISITTWALLALSATALQGQSFDFALIGDMPYHPDDSVKFDRLIDDISADSGLQWVMHAGDIKSGASVCSDAYFQARFDWYARFALPLILTPGDNEWTDCHRPSAGMFQPGERLTKLREIFYADPRHSLGQQKMPLRTQADQPAYATFREHQRWEKNGVHFATFHIVGSRNARAQFPGRTHEDDREVEARTRAAIAWLKETFADAQTKGKGVFLLIHANPGFERRQDSLVAQAFGPFLDELEKQVIAFRRPVILAHGDSHYFRYDKPLLHSQTGRRIEWFSRLENFGARDIHWVRVSVDPEDPQVFRIHQEWIPENFEPHE